MTKWQRIITPFSRLSPATRTSRLTPTLSTINNACGKIFDDCAGKGYVLTGNETFVLRANPSLKAKIEKAFALTFNGMSTNPNQIVYNIDRMYTTKLANTSYYVGLPGRKAKVRCLE